MFNSLQYNPQFHIHDTQDDIDYTKAIVWKVPIPIIELSGNVVRKGDIASFEQYLLLSQYVLETSAEIFLISY